MNPRIAYEKPLGPIDGRIVEGEWRPVVSDLTLVAFLRGLIFGGPYVAASWLEGA